jgi:hypothetical protein
MVGIPGNAPKTRGQRIAGVIGAVVVFGFIGYVIVKNVFHW